MSDSFGANAIADRLQQARSRLEELLNGTRQEQNFLLSSPKSIKIDCSY